MSLSSTQTTNADDKPNYPLLWKQFHIVLFQATYNPHIFDQDALATYILRFHERLKCETCVLHYQEQMETNPPPFQHPEDLFRWSVDIHNSVNTRLGKPVLKYEQAHAIYAELFKPKQTSGVSRKQVFGWIILVLALFGIGYFASRKVVSKTNPMTISCAVTDVSNMEGYVGRE